MPRTHRFSLEQKEGERGMIGVVLGIEWFMFSQKMVVAKAIFKYILKLNSWLLIPNGCGMFLFLSLSLSLSLFFSLSLSLIFTFLPDQ